MIVGHGVDILEKDRFNNLFNKYQNKLITKCFGKTNNLTKR